MAWLGKALSKFLGRSAASAPAVTRTVDAAFDSKINDAHEALRAVGRSKTVLSDVDAALKRSVAELSRLDMLELRKLAHHAYHGIGAWWRPGRFVGCNGRCLIIMQFASSFVAHAELVRHCCAMYKIIAQ